MLTKFLTTYDSPSLQCVNGQQLVDYFKRNSEDTRMNTVAQFHLNQARVLLDITAPRTVCVSARGQGANDQIQGAALLGHDSYSEQQAIDYLSTLDPKNYKVSAWGDEWRIEIDNPRIQVASNSFGHAAIKAVGAYLQLTWGNG